MACDRHIWDTEDPDRYTCPACEQHKYASIRKEIEKIYNMAKDKCVMCGIDSTYDVSTDIDMRTSYIIGMGQLCNKCYRESSIQEDFQAPKLVTESPVETFKISAKMIRDTPNNMDLGEKIRNLLS